VLTPAGSFEEWFVSALSLSTSSRSDERGTERPRMLFVSAFVTVLDPDSVPVVRPRELSGVGEGAEIGVRENQDMRLGDAAIS